MKLNSLFYSNIILTVEREMNCHQSSRYARARLWKKEWDWIPMWWRHATTILITKTKQTIYCFAVSVWGQSFRRSRLLFKRILLLWKGFVFVWFSFSWHDLDGVGDDMDILLVMTTLALGTIWEKKETIRNDLWV